MSTNLTTLERVKRYLAITGTAQDTLIGELIASCSREVERYCVRKFPSITRSSVKMSGHGGRLMVLPDYPIISVQGLSINGVAVAASTDGVFAPGYVADESSLYVIGTSFSRGKMNVVASWTAGYQAAEVATIPSGNTPQVVLSAGLATELVSVTRTSNETAFTEVASSPASGQFTFSPGLLTFASADAGVEIEATYRYVPLEVERACIEMIGLDLKQRDNIGIQSKSMAGESITYSDKGMTASTRQLLRPFVRKSPIPGGG